MFDTDVLLVQRLRPYCGELWHLAIRQLQQFCLLKVLEKETVDEQIVEMREYFKAFKNQDSNHRDYEPYFRVRTTRQLICANLFDLISTMKKFCLFYLHNCFSRPVVFILKQRVAGKLLRLVSILKNKISLAECICKKCFVRLLLQCLISCVSQKRYRYIVIGCSISLYAVLACMQV